MAARAPPSLPRGPRAGLVRGEPARAPRRPRQTASAGTRACWSMARRHRRAHPPLLRASCASREPLTTTASRARFRRTACQCRCQWTRGVPAWCRRRRPPPPQPPRDAARSLRRRCLPPRRARHPGGRTVAECGHATRAPHRCQRPSWSPPPARRGERTGETSGVETARARHCVERSQQSSTRARARHCWRRHRRALLCATRAAAAQRRCCRPRLRQC